LFLPFLPLLPVQILLNNLLYDVSEVGIPFDRVDADDLLHPRAWDMGAILRFTVVMGALSSVFDLATFAVLLKVFETDPDTFRTAWFIESTVTQILVIFLIRTHGRFWASRAHPLLVVSSLGALTIALIIAFFPIGHGFSFVSLPLTLLAVIGMLVVTYLITAEFVKTVAWRAK
jgi:Mg2+-importing ATPase